jgi:catalase (peroxidase I)
MTGAAAIEKSGGPKIDVSLGRTDKDASCCPPNGRLPDASQGAQHLRDVFYRMGFNDQEIVALSGAHTLGRCHTDRSGFDGPWTTDPLKFDNEYFTNLLELKWTPRKWDGPLQYEDPSGKLMMLPTDLALIEDESFKPWVEKYAADADLFSKDFAAAFAKLLSNGCPFHKASS